VGGTFVFVERLPDGSSWDRSEGSGGYVRVHVFATWKGKGRREEAGRAEREETEEGRMKRKKEGGRGVCLTFRRGQEEEGRGRKEGRELLNTKTGGETFGVRFGTHDQEFGGHGLLH
jgi:hypothetical protein